MQRDKTKELFLRFSDLDWGHIYRNRRNYSKTGEKTIVTHLIWHKFSRRELAEDAILSNYCQWTGNIIAWSSLHCLETKFKYSLSLSLNK
jgi:hypothetical protein